MTCRAGRTGSGTFYVTIKTRATRATTSRAVDLQTKVSEERARLSHRTHITESPSRACSTRCAITSVRIRPGFALNRCLGHTGRALGTSRTGCAGIGSSIRIRAFTTCKLSSGADGSVCAVTGSNSRATRYILGFLLCIAPSAGCHRWLVLDTRRITHCWRMSHTDKVCTEMHQVRNMLQLHKRFDSAEGGTKVSPHQCYSPKSTHLPVRAVRASCTLTTAGGVVLTRSARRPAM